ncbi:hypothetical protein [Tepidibacter hydrothermalis]|uniref:Phage protein n=1 Tax=Tepidibacter hydrothermalis TaxID=3036126 RepID=A0ABY8EGE8_9FIRM|nr:hypothetical protein [Tepidibacter hydrothermalis]WFD12022.1 hypothetical protein P4S50_08070 [Tepidibacter hydrothermalis]
MKNINEYIELIVLATLVIYLFAGAFYLKDNSNTDLIIGAFLGVLGSKKVDKSRESEGE